MALTSQLLMHIVYYGLYKKQCVTSNLREVVTCIPFQSVSPVTVEKRTGVSSALVEPTVMQKHKRANRVEPDPILQRTE